MNVDSASGGASGNLVTFHNDEHYWVRYVNGKPDNDNGPAVVAKKFNAEMWYRRGELHRPNGPAVVVSGENFTQTEWWCENKMHCLTQPAWRYENFQGKVVEQWWVGGETSVNVALCRVAADPSSAEDVLIDLCVHEDVVVRSLALANPSCPKEGKAYHAITY